MDKKSHSLFYELSLLVHALTWTAAYAWMALLIHVLTLDTLSVKETPSHEDFRCWTYYHSSHFKVYAHMRIHL